MPIRSSGVTPIASRQDVLFRPGMGLHAAVRARKDMYVLGAIAAAYAGHRDKRFVLGVAGDLLDEVILQVEDHALAKLEDGTSVVYEARERDVADSTHCKEVGLPRDLFARVRDMTFEGLRQRYWRSFVESPQYTSYLQFKTMETKVSTVLQTCCPSMRYSCPMERSSVDVRDATAHRSNPTA